MEYRIETASAGLSTSIAQKRQMIAYGNMEISAMKNVDIVFNRVLRELKEYSEKMEIEKQIAAYSKRRGRPRKAN